MKQAADLAAQIASSQSDVLQLEDMAGLFIMEGAALALAWMIRGRRSSAKHVVKVRDSLRAHNPKIDAIWHSSTKPGDKYAASLRSKVVLSGDNACRCVDADGNVVAMPSEWAGLAVIPIITIRGVHLQKAMAGLIMETTALLVGEVQVGHGLRFNPLRRIHNQHSAFTGRQ
jgi:hypothetical protein